MSDEQEIFYGPYAITITTPPLFCKDGVIELTLHNISRSQQVDIALEFDSAGIKCRTGNNREGGYNNLFIEIPIKMPRFHTGDRKSYRVLEKSEVSEKNVKLR